VVGIKISLLSAEKEIAMRNRLLPDVHMITGGDDNRHSDALLGIFDAIAPAASEGLVRLAKRG
jgi:hypothetical protein